MSEIKIWKNTLDPVRKGWRWSLPYIKEDQFIGRVAPTYGWALSRKEAEETATLAKAAQDIFRKQHHATA